jgi:hippurate hydrolase
MPVINRIAGYAEEMAEWRRWLHRNPELAFDCHRTAAFVAERLRAFGVDEIHEGIATTGIVAIVNGQGPGPTVGLRADMDALPIREMSGAPYASETEGKMHACGHDGHTTMLLGAAKYLAETRNFRGRAALIFQPAEEDGGGGGVMVREGIMDRFDIAEVYALHNAPNFEEGRFYTTPGPIMAAVDEFEVVVEGHGGHAAMPHETADPLVAAVAMVQAFQAIVSRNHKPVEELVVSVTQFRAGTANNVIPATAVFSGTVRTFEADVQKMVARRMEEIVAGIAAGYGVAARLDYSRHYPPTINDPHRAAFAAEVAAEIVGADRVDPSASREMGAEDFSFMLEARPGAYLFLGQGPGPVCHHPAYDFNDRIAPIGASFFARLIERAIPVKSEHDNASN